MPSIRHADPRADVCADRRADVPRGIRGLTVRAVRRGEVQSVIGLFLVLGVCDAGKQPCRRFVGVSTLRARLRARL